MKLCLQKGQLGHGDSIQRDRPTVVSELSKYVASLMLNAVVFLIRLVKS